MRNSWTVRRTLQPHPDAQRLWDRVYQPLLRATQQTTEHQMARKPPQKAVGDASSHLCPGLETAPGADPDR